MNLRSTLDDLDSLVDVAKPATRDLPGVLRDLPLIADARPTIDDLSALVRSPGPDNDLTDLTAQMPPLESQTSRVFPRTVRTLAEAQPVVEYGRAYTPELVGWIGGSQSAASYDANGHFAKISPLLAPFAYSGGSARAVAAGLEPAVLRRAAAAALSRRSRLARP